MTTTKTATKPNDAESKTVPTSSTAELWLTTANEVLTAQQTKHKANAIKFNQLTPDGKVKRGLAFRKLNLHDFLFPMESNALAQRIAVALQDIQYFFSDDELLAILSVHIEAYVRDRNVLVNRSDNGTDSLAKAVAKAKAKGMSDDQIMELIKSA